MADAEPHPPIVVADMRGERPQAVMTRDAAADLDAQLAGRQLELVLEHGDLRRRQLEEVRGFLHRAPRIVHEGRGLEQDDTLALQRAFRGLALKTAAPWCETMTPRDLVDGHEADIVPVMRVFRTGIAEADEQSHGAASRGALTSSCRLRAPSQPPREPLRLPPEPQPPREPRQRRLRPERQHRAQPQQSSPPPQRQRPPSALRRSRRAARW